MLGLVYHGAWSGGWGWRDGGWVGGLVFDFGGIAGSRGEGGWIYVCNPEAEFYYRKVYLQHRTYLLYIFRKIYISYMFYINIR